MKLGFDLSIVTTTAATNQQQQKQHQRQYLFACLLSWLLFVIDGAASSYLPLRIALILFLCLVAVNIAYLLR